MQQVVFEKEVFKRISSFYREKDDKYQPKKAEIKVMCQIQNKEEEISKVKLNLSSYLGRGPMHDTIQLYGSAYFLDFDIYIEPVPTQASSFVD